MGGCEQCTEINFQILMSPEADPVKITCCRKISRLMKIAFRDEQSKWVKANQQFTYCKEREGHLNPLAQGNRIINVISLLHKDLRSI